MDLTWIAALLVAVVGQPGSAPSTPDLPTGPPPAVAYAFAEHRTFGGGDWLLVRPDGGSRRPFSESLGEFVAYDDVVVNGYGTEGGFEVELFDGRPHLEHEQGGLCHYGLVVTPDRGEVAYLQNDGSLVEQYADGSLSTRPVELPGGPCTGAQPVALRGPKLYVDAPGTPPSVIAGPNHPSALRGFLDLADVSARGLLVGRLADDKHCSGLLRPTHGIRWRTCADRLVAFSPDGHHVLGTLAGPEPRGVVVHHTRTGGIAASWPSAPRQRITQVEWEDDGHVLIVVHRREVGWSVVRLGVDGSAEYAVTPVRTGGEFPPFRLQLS